MGLYRNIIILVLFLLLLLIHLILPSRSSSKNVLQSYLSAQSNTDLLDILETISDSRVRLSKLIATTVLGLISMWVAFPSSDVIVPGTGWYDPLWEKHDISGFRIVDEMISLSPCKDQDKIFIQIGAHLGIYPLLATYRGCYGIAVEPMPVAVNFTRITAKVNNWGSDKFSAINAIGGNENGGSMWFDPGTISISKNNSDLTNKILIPVTTLDTLNDEYGFRERGGQSRITFVIIDVEGHEQNVLLGAKRLITQRSVLVFEIEVWTRHQATGTVTSFPGLQLLIENGYRLYTNLANSEMSFNSCDELTHRLAELPKITNQTCQQPSFPKDVCLCEVYAVRSDLPSPRQWLSLCSK